jgi:hypothetical protein
MVEQYLYARCTLTAHGSLDLKQEIQIQTQDAVLLVLSFFNYLFIVINSDCSIVAVCYIL